MKISFVVPTLNFNGGLRVIAIYANYLSNFGHDVTVVSPGKPTPSWKQKVKSLMTGKPWEGDKKFSTVYFESLNFKLDILTSNRPVTENDLPESDIVIATWWETAFWVNRFPDIKGKKVYFMQDYGEVPGQPLDKIEETWRLPFHLITISRWLKNLVLDVRQSEEHLTLIPNGIELSSFRSEERNKNKVPTVGFLYTDAPQKGAALMLNAYLKAKEQYPDLRLIMFGSKDLPIEFKNISDITYHQRISDDKVAKVYSSCDAWLFGSSREGFGLPILEAMACRTPVISTRAGAAEELVTAESGYLLSSDSVEEMVSAILKVIELDNESWQNISRGALDTAKAHSWEVASRKFETTLLEVLDEPSLVN